MPENPSPANAILLAGGMGARLWPISRELFPKQLVRFFGDKSLIQHAIERLHPVIGPDRLTVVCGKTHFHEISRQIQDMGIDPKGKILCEPCGRNTAPAILLAVLTLLETEKDPVICIFPSDHVIGDVKRLHEKMTSAIRLAETGHIVTFGITPDYPETGYGYIEGGKKMAEGGRQIRRFVEKPNARRARDYVKSGRFFWNSGMFAFKASVLLAEYQALQPKMVRRMKRYIRSNVKSAADLYAGLENISIDFAILEHTRKGIVLPSDFEWSDIGSWKSLFDFLKKDENGNILNGDIVARETRGCFIMGGNRLVAVNHVSDMVLIETSDSVFVSSMENSRDVKSIVKLLQEQGRKEYRHHQTQSLPWGKRTVLEDVSDHYVRRIDIYPKKTYTVAKRKGWKKFLTLISGAAQIRQKPGGECFLQSSASRCVDIPGSAVVRNNSKKNLCLIEMGAVTQEEKGNLR